MLLRDLRPDDWPEIARIFEEGIRTGNATFETEVPSWEAWDAAHLPSHRLVAERDGCGTGAARGADRELRARWDLDARDGRLPGERAEPPALAAFRLPRRRDTRADRPDA